MRRDLVDLIEVPLMLSVVLGRPGADVLTQIAHGQEQLAS
jgi:hypothetical protein